MPRTTTPFRVTLILDADKSAVAQIERMETLTEDDGTVILSRALPAEPLEFPLSGELLGDLAAQAIARCKELDEQIATLTKDQEQADKDHEALVAEISAVKDAQLAAKDAELASIPSLQSRIAELESKVVALTPPPVPRSIKAWQAKAVLQLSGLLAAAETVIDGLEDPQRTVVLSAWTNNADFTRTSPTIAALGMALGFTEDQLDGMFQQAADLTV